jgi:23S rRNA (cytosine1962-C5)-methyltransferase
MGGLVCCPLPVDSGRLILKGGREKAVKQRHPWIYSGAVAKTEGDPSPGDTVDVLSVHGDFLGRGYFNPTSAIRVRLLTYDPTEEIGPGLFEQRIGGACQIRSDLFPSETTAYRLINGEGDLLPGLIVDRYGEYLVVQITTMGMERWRSDLLRILQEKTAPKAIYERSDTPVRRSEGLKSIRAHLLGSEIPPLIEIQEGGSRFWVDVVEGQKTGFYLDQRDNRMWAEQIADGREVLDCFCYTGAFSVHMARGGAGSLVLVDSSHKALELAEKNLTLNGVSVNHEVLRRDVFRFLREDERTYDLIVLDPPPFVRGKGTVAAACRGYKDIHLAAFRRLRRNGLLLSFSCSHHMGMDLFQKVIFSAALDARRQVQIVGKTGHGMDHPFSVYHPEGEYLKGVLCQTID